MEPNVPSVTVIVPARPDDSVVAAVNAARNFDYPADKLEILLARGKQPSVQRNAALHMARGELIYFLDDDSVAPPGQLKAGVARFADPTVKMLGGPNLCPPDAPLLEQVFAVVLSSWLAFGPSRARYDRVGAVRETSEKELILCNMMARRDILMELGGFDESLYPNEENALMDGIQQRGGKLVYDPDFYVHRHPRPTLKAFCTMLMNYGRGRAEQFRLHPTPGSALNFVPPGFCLYLVLLPALYLLLGRGCEVFWLEGPSWLNPLFWWGMHSSGLGISRAETLAFIPLAMYGVVVFLQTCFSIKKNGVGKSLLAMPLLVLTHLFYGMGFWKGLFTKVKSHGASAAGAVNIERITIRKSNFSE